MTLIQVFVLLLHRGAKTHERRQKLGSALEIDCGREDGPLPAAAAAAIKSALPLSLPIHL